MTSLAVPSSCVVTQTPMGTNSGTRRRKRKFPLLFVNCDRGRIEIDHLYGLRCRGWYCNPEQHSLCRPARPQAAARRPAQLVLFRIAVPTTPAQTVSWSIPIATSGIIGIRIMRSMCFCNKLHGFYSYSVTVRACLVPLDFNIMLGSYIFTLQATIDHRGFSMYSGHYTASVYCCEKTFSRNDDNITVHDMNITRGSSTTYVMIYKLRKE